MWSNQITTYLNQDLNQITIWICSSLQDGGLPVNGHLSHNQLECGPMSNVMAALLNIGGALCSTPQSLADAQYWSVVQ